MRSPDLGDIALSLTILGITIGGSAGVIKFMNFEDSKRGCEQRFGTYVCPGSGQSLDSRGIEISGSDYTAYITPRNGYTEIEPSKFLGIVIDGKGKVDRAIADLEAQGCGPAILEGRSQKLQKVNYVIAIDGTLGISGSIAGGVTFCQNSDFLKSL